MPNIEHSNLPICCVGCTVSSGVMRRCSICRACFVYLSNSSYSGWFLLVVPFLSAAVTSSFTLCTQLANTFSLWHFFSMIDSCSDELLHHTFTPPLSISSHCSHHCCNKGECTQYAQHVLRCTHFFKHSVRKTQQQTKKLLWMFIMYSFFSIYQRLYPLGERSEWDGLCSVYICRTKEEEAFSDVSARCTAFMGLH